MTIIVEQLGKDGQPFRTFKFYPKDESDLDARLIRIGRAYKADATRVTVKR